MAWGLPNTGKQPEVRFLIAIHVTGQLYLQGFIFQVGARHGEVITKMMGIKPKAISKSAVTSRTRLIRPDNHVGDFFTWLTSFFGLHNL